MFVKNIFFSPDGFQQLDNAPCLFQISSPNISANTGNEWAALQPGIDATAVADSQALAIGPESIGGLASVGGSGIYPGHAKFSFVIDATPVFASNSISANADQLTIWTPNLIVAKGEVLLDTNNHYQSCQVGGQTGSGMPTWNNSGGTTNDGTAQWLDLGVLPSTGAIHAYAEIIELPNVTIPFPAALEFIQQPSNTAAGATITPNITVKIKDQNGAPYLLQPISIDLQIMGAGTLNGTTPQLTDVSTGLATFNDLSITESGNGYKLVAKGSTTFGVPKVLSSSFNITP